MGLPWLVRLCCADRCKSVPGSCGKNLRRNAIPALLQAGVRHPWRTRWSHAISPCFVRSEFRPYDRARAKTLISARDNRNPVRISPNPLPCFNGLPIPYPGDQPIEDGPLGAPAPRSPSATVCLTALHLSASSPVGPRPVSDYAELMPFSGCSWFTVG